VHRSGRQVASRVYGALRLRQLREAEVQNLGAPILVDKDVFRLDVAMNDPFFMGCRQRLRNLNTEINRLADGQRAGGEPLAQRLPFQKF
jgi:hypothetical protein